MRSSNPLRLRWSLAAGLLVSLVWLGCTDSRDLAAPDDFGPNIRIVDQVALDRAIRVQEAHTEELMALEAVVGTAVGLTADGQPAVKILTSEAGVAGLPESLEGVPVTVEVTGMIFALRALADPTLRFDRPVPIGVSTGHPNITAGTIGARVRDAENNVYALSNNHVYADQNDANIGDGATQPGAFDGGTDPADRIGTLSDFEEIEFARGNRIRNNLMDAAIVLSSTQDLDVATPFDGGYGAPSSTTVLASMGLAVKKYGRTTKLTFGKVSLVNVTVDVCYAGVVVCTKFARFVEQIAITDGSFSGGGDSGSLIVTKDGNNPVALLFAGGSTLTFASPIDPILTQFEVTIDGEVAAPNNPPSADANGPYSGSEDAAITFNGSGSSDPDGDPLTYSWDFGDGNTATTNSVNISHTYLWGGTFTVALTVSDGKGGTGTAGSSAIVTEVNDKPVADPAGPYSGTEGEAITFDGSGSSDFDNEDGTAANDQTLTYNWTFGDGNAASTPSATITHSYASAGSYPVTLVVNDGGVGGASVLANTTATVNVLTVGAEPVVDLCTPNIGNPGDRFTVAVTGSKFVDGATVSFGQQVQVRDVSFSETQLGTQLDVQIRINKRAPSDTRTVTVTNPDGKIGFKTDCFFVN